MPDVEAGYEPSGKGIAGAAEEGKRDDDGGAERDGGEGEEE